MKYRTLVQFNHSESVMQLRTADERATVERLVHTYVISKRMVELLERLDIPHLQRTTPAGNQGLSIVSN